MEFIILSLISVSGIYFGIRGVSNKRYTSEYYNGISYLLYGCSGLFSIVVFLLFGYESMITVYSFLPLFLIGGGYGLLYKKKIKNDLFFRIDFFAFLSGVLLLFFIIFEFFFPIDSEYFMKTNIINLSTVFLLSKEV